MRLLIQNGILLTPNATTPTETRNDIFIQDGIIQKIAKNIMLEADEIFDATDCYISIGYLDVGAYVGDPGFEHQEDVDSLSAAAAVGGYTAVATLPNTFPSVHSKSEVLYLKNNTLHHLTDILPIGAVSKNCAGEELAELYDMHEAGAVAFSDGTHSVRQAGVLLRALDYTKTFRGLVINHPHDSSLMPNGQMHEGLISTKLGLRGIPSISEELMLARDLQLLAYTQSKLHILNVSTQKSVDLIRAAKQEGLQVTASVAALNLTHTEDDLDGFEVQLKVQPPLRSTTDRAALIAGLKDGTIDCITSNHRPLEPEAKKRAFLDADFGTIGLETTMAALHTANVLPMSQLVEKIAYQPRKVLNLAAPAIEEGQSANFTIFHPDLEWTYEADAIRSKSRNSPFIGRKFKGKVVAVGNGMHFQKL
ncbi:MAG: dihydroorotase [Bacteroidota bacterium]